MTYSHEELYQTHYLKEDKENNETKETKEEKERAQKTYEQSRKEFIFLNIVVIGFTVLLGIISYIVPTNKNIKVLPNYLINHILPMIYFTIFSFLFGGIFLLGDDEMRGFLGYFFKDKILNLGIIASYFGIISIIIALCVKHIIQNILGLKIKAVPIYDIIGFLIGRIILLALIYFLEKKYTGTKDPTERVEKYL
jgi:hypothetical protein